MTTMTNLYSAGDVVTLDFPGATGTKRRPAVVLSSDFYHAARPDVIVGLLTSQTSGAGATTDYVLRDWQAAGLRLPLAFRTFLATLPRAVVVSRIGALSQTDWQEVRARVGIAFDMRW